LVGKNRKRGKQRIKNVENKAKIEFEMFKKEGYEQ